MAYVVHLVADAVFAGLLIAAIATTVTADISLRGSSGDGTIMLVTFDGKAETTHKWLEMNDPVMGGKSTGTFNVTNGAGVFDGDVVNVPFLKAPGFIKSSTVDAHGFPDITSCSAITLKAKAASDYAGFRLCFGNAHPSGGKFFAYGYKTHFDAPVGDSYQEVVMPLNNFTDFWDDATGNPIKTCAQNKEYCPNEKTLQNMKTISVWGEGVAGKVHLEIDSIWASGCK